MKRHTSYSASPTSPTTMKTILVFQLGNLIKQITYRNKKEAQQQFGHFKKHGLLDYASGKVIPNCKFELI